MKRGDEDQSEQEKAEADRNYGGQRHLLMMMAEVEVRQAAAVMTMEEETIVREEVEDVMTRVRNGRSTAIGNDSGSGRSTPLVPPQGSSIVQGMDASLLEDVKETSACQWIDTLLTANVDSGSKSIPTTDRHVSKCSCVDLKILLITTIGTKPIN